LENKEIPDDVDLAIIAVKAELVPQILEDCGKKQITNAIVISSGFKEMGPVGKELEDIVAAVAKQNNINLLGPNCLGIIDTKSDLNASFSPHKPLPGKIALLSQSGALGTAMLDWATGEGVGFSKFISLGNEAQLNEIDFLKYLKNPYIPTSTIAMIYIPFGIGIQYYLPKKWWGLLIWLGISLTVIGGHYYIRRRKQFILEHNKKNL